MPDTIPALLTSRRAWIAQLLEHIMAFRKPSADLTTYMNDEFRILSSKQHQSYFKHSSTITRCAPTATPHINHRSWLKFDKITRIPSPSFPRVFSIGAWTLSKVTNAVPAAAEYDVLTGFVSTPSDRSTRIVVYPV
jgi:hypothetical protein